MAINIENSICEAIEYIVENAVANANFDKTVQATIISCVDEATGKYKVRYQDSSFYAYAQTPDMKYFSGKSVYVLIPSNNMSNNKTILGTVDKLGTNFTPVISEDEKYEIVGTDCIDSVDHFELCSYSTPELQVLYDKQNKINNKINVNLISMDTYIRQSKYIICGATFQTALPLEQQQKGNYGVVFELNYHTENSNDEIITKTYTVDINQMLGNPYKMTQATRQYGIFEIDTNKFVDINKIYIFAYDFPKTKENMLNDIIITNIELSGAVEIEQNNELDYSLSLTTPQGSYFYQNEDEQTTREIHAQLKVKGKTLDNNQDIKYYWFVENIGITNSSTKYNQYGGLGWECLNQYNVLSSNDQNVPINIEWVPGGNIYSILKQRVYAKENIYKCVAVYNDIVLSRTITIINYSSLYDVQIISDSGTQFYFDIGNPTLTCQISGREMVGDEYHYVWAKVDNNNSFELLQETTAYNDDYNYYKKLYDELKELVETEQALPNTSQDFLDEYLAEMKKYDKIMRVEQNKLINVQVKEINNFATYKCSVFIGESCLGTGTITLLNTLKTENGYDILIKNGTQVFKYNENGVSPVSKSLIYPQTIMPLVAAVYDNKGNILSDEILQTCEIKWIVPKQNTMLKISNEYDEYILLEEEDYIVYTDLLSLPYTIAENYNSAKSNNTIQLSITYQGLALLKETQFTFLKEGDSGTNGTDIVCLIVPNTTDDINIYPTIVNGVINYSVDDNRWFKVQLWNNGQLIFNHTATGKTTEEKTANVTWSMLSNIYNSEISDPSDLIIDAQTGECQYLGYGNNNIPANIVKAKVVYNNIEYYATLPIITAEINNIDNIALKQHTGFRHVIYSADGQRPQYNSTNPFELQIWQTIDNVQELISNVKVNNLYKLKYQWEVVGQIYDTSSKAWVNKTNLIVKNKETLTTNTLEIKPTDIYDGECVSNAIKCVIKQQNNIIARIHIPIHLSLNRYGLSLLNDWDGNSLLLNQNGGYILTPQIGAGKKEDDNSFTGMLIGQVKEANQKNTDTGLIAYHRGVRSMYLSAYDGYALFGKTGSGQIALDPSHDKALLYSHDFWTKYYSDTTNSKRNGLPITDYVYDLKSYTYSNQSNNGMLIDLTTPRIIFGSGNFRVEPEGFLYAKGGGTIGGWDILDHSLSANYEHVGISSVSNKNDMGARVYPIPTSSGVNTEAAIAFWAGYDNFYVSHDGYVRMNTATIGDGNLSNLIYIGKAGEYSSIYSGKKNSLSKDESGFYLGTDGFSLGKVVDYSDVTGNAYTENYSKFEVKKDGTFYAKDAYIKGSISAESGLIGGWTIEDNYLKGTSSNGKYIKINSNGAIVSTDGTNEYWKIDRDGSAKFTNISITGGSTQIGEDFKVSTAGKLVAASAEIEGKITATEGKIAGFTISGDTLYGSQVGMDAESGGDYAFWAGATKGNSPNAPFRVGHDGSLFASKVEIEGKITASSGKVGDWEISGGKLLSTNTNGHVTGLATSTWPGDPAFYAGGPDPWSDSDWVNKVPFYVTNEGYLKATNARIEGTIKATSGEFDNCTIKSGCTVPASTIQGQLASGNIPLISADKISGGTIDATVLDGVSASFGQIGASAVRGMTVSGDLITVNNSLTGAYFIGDYKGKTGSFWIMTGWTESGNGKITFKGRNCTFTGGIITSIGDETTATANT